jgi:hypothetical protein
MSTPAAPRRGPSRVKLFFWLMVVPAVLVALYFYALLQWNYSTGERAGWVQKFSKKGWICKTWEGELSMVSMPGATPEKFHFTVWDQAVAAQINGAMGRRVSLHYEEKVGLPTTCFGDTRHWVNGIAVVPEIPLSPGITVPVPPGLGTSPTAPPAPAAAPAEAARPPASAQTPPSNAPAAATK